MHSPSIRFYRSSDLAEPVLKPITATTTVDATSGQPETTETALATITIPADWMTVGRGLWLVAAGTYRGQTSLGAPTTTFRVRINGVAGVVTLQSNDLDLGNFAGERMWDLRALITCRTIGGSGTLFSQGAVTIVSTETHLSASAMNAAGASALLGNTATQAIDTTTSNSMVLTVKHSATTANHYVRITNAHCLAIGG